MIFKQRNLKIIHFNSILAQQQLFTPECQRSKHFKDGDEDDDEDDVFIYTWLSMIDDHTQEDRSHRFIIRLIFRSDELTSDLSLTLVWFWGFWGHNNICPYILIERPLYFPSITPDLNTYAHEQRDISASTGATSLVLLWLISTVTLNKSSGLGIIPRKKFSSNKNSIVAAGSSRTESRGESTLLYSTHTLNRARQQQSLKLRI